MNNDPYDYLCLMCGRYRITCFCYRQKQDYYKEYMRKLTEVKAAPPIDYDKLADLIAAKVVALLGKKKRRASR